jgi:hypothetical protein
MNAVKLAGVILIRDALISLVAAAGWPRWPWAHRTTDRLTTMAETMQGGRTRP